MFDEIILRCVAWQEAIYSYFFTCSNPHCKEIVVCSGTGEVTQYYNDDSPYKRGLLSFEYRGDFTPKYFVPHLKLLSILTKTPDEVRAAINNSFSLFFSSPPSAGNQRVQTNKKLYCS